METKSQKLFLMDHDESQITPNVNLVIKEVEVIGEKTRIPPNKLQHSIEKLESLYKEWKNLQKIGDFPIKYKLFVVI